MDGWPSIVLIGASNVMPSPADSTAQMQDGEQRTANLLVCRLVPDCLLTCPPARMPAYPPADRMVFLAASLKFERMLDRISAPNPLSAPAPAATRALTCHPTSSSAS
jgi:hypothetical protein